MSWTCVFIILMLSPDNLSDMSCMDANPDDFSYVYPSSLSQELMVSMILSASWVRPSSTLVEDWYVDALGFLLDNFWRTMGLHSPTLIRMHASMDLSAQHAPASNNSDSKNIQQVIYRV